MILTLQKTIPSGSHNAPWNETDGSHWPAGQRFRLLSKRKQVAVRQFHRLSDSSTAVEQVGGEEVLVVVSNSRFQELFGVELPT